MSYRHIYATLTALLSFTCTSLYTCQTCRCFTINGQIILGWSQLHSPIINAVFFQDTGRTVFDKLRDNRHKRAEMKTPYHRVAANGISTQDRATGWASMLMMLFKVALNLENVFSKFRIYIRHRWNIGETSRCSRLERLVTSKLGYDVIVIDYIITK